MTSNNTTTTTPIMDPNTDNNKPPTMTTNNEKSNNNNNKAHQLILRKRLQALSAIPFAMFVMLHMGVHATFHFGMETHRTAFLWSRKFYNKYSIIEAGLLGSAFIHAMISLSDGWKRSMEEWQGMLKDPSRLLHNMLGYVLVILIPIHTYFGRIENVKSGLNDPEIGTFATFFLPEIFVPYYITLSLAGVIHMSLGLVKVARILKFPIQPTIKSKMFQAFTTIFSLICVSTVFAIAGFYFPVTHRYAKALLAYSMKKYPFPNGILQFLQKRYIERVGGVV
jgi:hypothetical protein